MSLARLLTQSVSVRVPTGTTVDAEGDVTTGYAAPVAYLARLEQTAATEVTTGQERALSDWLLILPPSATITARSRVDADGHTYEVVGAPMVARTPRGPHHIEARLALVEA